MIKRIKSFLKDIERLDGNIAVVSHSGAIETFINLSQELKKEEFIKLKQDNTCINHLIYNGNKWKIKTINDVMHIKDLEPDIEYYNGINEFYGKLKEFLKSKKYNLEDFNIIEGLKDNKIGRYQRIFMRYSGTPIKLELKDSDKITTKSLKVMHIYEDYKEYEIGKIKINNTTHKVCLIDKSKSNNSLRPY